MGGGIAPYKLRDMMGDGALLTSLDFMLTQSCNFECTWCFAESSPLKQTFLPFKNLVELTKDSSDIGVNLFVLTGGEPLIYRDPALGRSTKRGDHFFQVVEMIRDTNRKKENDAKILTFDDVALITPEIAQRFADNKVGLCTKGDTLNPELQDYKVNQQGAFEKIQKGYENLISVGYGSVPELRLVVNSVLYHTTFVGMLDLHMWVIERGFDHSIVPVHYCGNAGDDDQEAGTHSPHVRVLYGLLTRIDAKFFGVEWESFSAFTYDKTCNRNISGLHIRANGDITSCSESPGTNETTNYTFGNILTDENFSLKVLVNSERLANYRIEFAQGHGDYVCAPQICDLNAEDLCRGGCAVRSAYSKIDTDTGLIIQNENPSNYSKRREDPLCPAWTVLAERQGILKEGLREEIHHRLLEKNTRVNIIDFPFE